MFSFLSAVGPAVAALCVLAVRALWGNQKGDGIQQLNISTIPYVMPEGC